MSFASEIVSVSVPPITPPSISASKKKKLRAKKKLVVDQVLHLSGIKEWMDKQDNVQLDYTEKQGRFLVAKRKIKAFEVILQSIPAAAVVSSKNLDVCHVCFQTSEVLYMCPGCNWFKSCSGACQNAARQVHHYECAMNKALQNDNKALNECKNTAVRLLMRCLVIAMCEEKEKQRKKGDNQRMWTITPGATVEDSTCLLSHFNEFEQDYRQSFTEIAEQVRTLVFPESWTSIQESAEMLARIQTNAHGITNGLALYPIASLINHSCSPNSVWNLSSRPVNAPIMEFRALKDIEAGEIITYSYVDLYTPRSVRLEILKSSYLFECTCNRCAEPLVGSLDAQIAVSSDNETLGKLKLEQVNKYVSNPNEENLQDALALTLEISEMFASFPYSYIRFNANLLQLNIAFTLKKYSLVLEAGGIVLECLKLIQMDSKEIESVYFLMANSLECMFQESGNVDLRTSCLKYYRDCLEVRTHIYGESHFSLKEVANKIRALTKSSKKK